MPAGGMVSGLDPAVQQHSFNSTNLASEINTQVHEIGRLLSVNSAFHSDQL